MSLQKEIHKRIKDIDLVGREKLSTGRKIKNWGTLNGSDLQINHSGHKETIFYAVCAQGVNYIGKLGSWGRILECHKSSALLIVHKLLPHFLLCHNECSSERWVDLCMLLYQELLFTSQVWSLMHVLLNRRL